jgi:hypothetical protein
MSVTRARYGKLIGRELPIGECSQLALQNATEEATARLVAERSESTWADRNRFMHGPRRPNQAIKLFRRGQGSERHGRL